MTSYNGHVVWLNVTEVSKQATYRQRLS